MDYYVAKSTAENCALGSHDAAKYTTLHHSTKLTSLWNNEMLIFPQYIKTTSLNTHHHTHHVSSKYLLQITELNHITYSILHLLTLHSFMCDYLPSFICVYEHQRICATVNTFHLFCPHIPKDYLHYRERYGFTNQACSYSIQHAF